MLLALANLDLIPLDLIPHRKETNQNHNKKEPTGLREAAWRNEAKAKNPIEEAHLCFIPPK